jgi:hypothetical protein
MRWRYKMLNQNNHEDSAIKFHLHQYESLRKELESCVREMRTIERYALIGTGVVWAWLATNQQIRVHYIVWWIPVLFSLLGGLRTFALIKSVRRLAAYIQTVESAFMNKRLEGWETFITQNRRQSIRYSIYLFWIILMLATIIVPIVIRP